MAKKIVFWASGLISVCLLSLVIISPAFSDAEIGIAAFNNDGSLPTKEQIINFETGLGKTISTVNWYMGFSNAVNDQPDFPLNGLRTNVRDHDGYNTGIIPMLTWEPWGEALDAIVDTSHPDYAGMQNYILNFATGMRDYGAPIRLRFGQEMVQDNDPLTPGWYPWQDRPEDYKDAFKKVHDIFSSAGAANVQFVWSPSNTSPDNSPSDFTVLQEYYPGAAYVDWLGIDGYNLGNLGHGDDTDPGQYFADVFANTYATFISNEGVDFFGDKPIMLAEIATSNHTGLDSFDKAAWITDAFLTMAKGQYPERVDEYYEKIKAFYWFNVDKRVTIAEIGGILDADRFSEFFYDDGEGRALFKKNFVDLINADPELGVTAKQALLALWDKYGFERDWRLDSSPESWDAFKAAMQDPHYTGHTVVPEPISCALFLLGGGALVVVRKMRG
ncbi:MAG: glycosyl hydrolase [Candidatus Omnitrophota bacterium]